MIAGPPRAASRLRAVSAAQFCASGAGGAPGAFCAARAEPLGSINTISASQRATAQFRTSGSDLMVFIPLYGNLGAPAGVTGGPLVSVFWTASINHILPSFVRTNIGKEVLISLPSFSVLLVATRTSATSGRRNRTATDVMSRRQFRHHHGRGDRPADRRCPLGRKDGPATVHEYLEEGREYVVCDRAPRQRGFSPMSPCAQLNYNVSNKSGNLLRQRWATSTFWLASLVNNRRGSPCRSSR
jgi:hypothetical protein